MTEQEQHAEEVPGADEAQQPPGATAARLETSITESLRQAGGAQLRLLAGTARISLVQSDFTTLQTIVHDIAKQGERVIESAVIDRSGKILAHSNAKLVGQEAVGSLQNVELEPRPLRDAIIKRFHTFLDGAPPEDDVTLVIGELTA